MKIAAILFFTFFTLTARTDGQIDGETDPVEEMYSEEISTDEIEKEPEKAEEKAEEKVETAKPAMSKEEIEKIVKKMVEEELSRRESEQKEEVAEEKPRKLPEGDGLLTPNFTNNSITFIMGDDNLRDNSQYSVKYDIGHRYEYEDFAQRVYGYSNTAASSTRLTLFHEEDGLFENLSTRVGIAFRMYNTMNSLNDKIETKLREDKSFIEIDYRHPSRNRFKLTFYPYNADNIAIGYFRGLKWGNSTVWPQSSGSPAPGFQALYGYKDMSLYFGFKTHAQAKVDKLNTEQVPMETVYGFYGGVSYLNKELGLKGHLQGAIIDKGDNVVVPDDILSHKDDDKIISYGIDVFGEYSRGSELGDPLGINTYADGIWIEPDYTSSLAMRFRGEYMFQNQRLSNADYLGEINVTSPEPITDNFMGHGAIGEATLRFKGFRASFLYSFRTLPFMVFDAPGVEPYQTISSRAEQSPEHLFSVWADYHIKNFWLGVFYGFKIPATYTVYDANGQKTVTVIKERLSTDAVSTAFDRSREVLPPGEDAVNMLFLKVNAKYKFSRSVSVMLEYSFTQDHNRQKMVEKTNSSGKGTGVFVSDWDDIKVKDIHGLMFLVEGRF